MISIVSSPITNWAISPSGTAGGIAMNLNRRKVVQWAAAGLVGAAFPAPALAQSREKLRFLFDFSPWGYHAATHLAAQKGWFNDAGLDVEFLDGRGSAYSIQVTASGQADIASAQLGPMAIARENKLPLTSIAGWVRKTDLAVLVPADSPISTVADLKGKKISCFSSSPWLPYIDPFLRAGKLSRDDVSITMVAPDALVSVYVAGTVDAVMTTAPFGLPLLTASKPSKPILAADYGIAFPSYGLVALEETVKNKASALSAFAKVQQKAWIYTYDGHTDEAVDAIIAMRPDVRLNRANLKGQLEAYRAFFDSKRTAGRPYGLQAKEDWDDALTLMEAAKVVKPGWKAEQYFTNALLEG